MKLSKKYPKLDSTLRSAIILHTRLRFDPSCSDIENKSKQLDEYAREIIKNSRSNNLPKKEAMRQTKSPKQS